MRETKTHSKVKLDILFFSCLIFSQVLLEKRFGAIHSQFHRKKLNNDNNKVIHFIFPFVFFFVCFVFSSYLSEE